jgi:hypothetical protein
MKPQDHPFAQAIEPLVVAIGGSIVSPEDMDDGDIPLDWEGERVVGVRLVDIVSLERLIATMEEQLGSPLAELDRVDKQKAVRMLEERGAFQLRRSIEQVGSVMGVSRITIYNYLNATRADS